MNARRRVKATSIGLAAILLWSFLAAKAGRLPPFGLLALSFGAAFLGGLVLLGLRGRHALAKLRRPLRPRLAAFTGIFFYHALHFYALSGAPVAEASLVNYLCLLFIVLFSALLLEESLRERHLAGALFGFAGTAFVVLARGVDESFVAAIPGSLLATSFKTRREEVLA